ncbi:unnamed protein product [Rotaria sp. Silwood1]|nr:unnamed protein product [Rotaria sp. Silwood1]
MATNSENSPGHESVVIDNDEGISVESNRTTTHIKSKVFFSKNNERVLIEKGVKGSFVTVNRFKHFGFIKRKDKIEWPDIFAREASIIDQVRPKKFFVADTCKFDIMKICCIDGLFHVSIRLYILFSSYFHYYYDYGGSRNRATKSSGLYLIGDFVPPKPPEPNDAVAMMFKNMRSERMLKFSLEFPEESQEERFSIMFHNVQSLNKRISNIKFDKTFLSSSMISLVETWTIPSDNLEIEGFKIVHRRDCDDVRKPFGQIIYLKNDLKYENITERYEYSGKNHIEYSSIKIDDICIISVYNSPNSSFDILKRHINEAITISKGFCENTIVVGDFNINLKIKINNKFIEYMESFGLN